MTNKRGSGDNARKAPPTSNQKGCKGSSCQSMQKGNKMNYYHEKDEEEHPGEWSSCEDYPYSKKASTSQSKPGNGYRLAQRPGEDEDDDFDDEDEDEDDFDEDEDDDDEDEDEDEDEDYEDEDEEYEEEEESSTRSPSQYMLHRGHHSLAPSKQGQKNAGSAYRPNQPSKQGKKMEERTSNQAYKKNQPSSKKK